MGHSFNQKILRQINPLHKQLPFPFFCKPSYWPVQKFSVHKFFSENRIYPISKLLKYVVSIQSSLFFPIQSLRKFLSG